MEQDRERGQHRSLAFDKMEGLVREMQDPVNGVPVGCQKLFLTSIPSVFLGYDLIEWLMERLGIEESEALNLANLLCQYGYFFPVSDSRNLVVKDDSSLYRFQVAGRPFPLSRGPNEGSRTPDNIEYAIYLAKRTLRNKQRHGLEDYELESLNNLRKNLANKWDFILCQAEEQVRNVKERRKGEKLVSDSQERAYWRVYRPPPNVVSPLEQCPVPTRSRNGGSRTRRRTIVELRREVDLLKSSLTRTRVKVSVALESMVHHVETYTEYDPLLTGTQPSNPWVNEDTTFWHLNGPVVEQPTVKRVKRWGLSMEELVSDPTGLQEFTNYLRKEYSHENIRFWLAVNDLRRSSQSQIQRKVCEIFEEFLAPGAPCEINIDGKTMERVHQEMKQPSRFTFDSAAEHVYALLLKKDCYPRFIRSEHYKNLIATGIQPSHKKRFFGFVGPAKKKSSTTTAPNQSLLHQAGASGGSGPSATSSGGAGGAGVGASGGPLGRRRGSDRSLSGSAHELAISGVRDASSRVPHSHSQSNLSEIPYRDPGQASTSGVASSSGTQDVCPWDTPGTSAQPGTSVVPDAYEGEASGCRPKKSSIIAVVTGMASGPEDVCPWEGAPSTSLRSRKNSAQFDSGSSSSDISAAIADVSDRLRRSCGLTQQNTFDGDRRSQYSRKLSTASCIEATRRSSISVATKLPESARPSVSSFEDFAPQRSFDSSSVTSPCNVFISDSDNNKHEAHSVKTKKPQSLRKTSSVTSSSVAPIISVSSVMDDTITGYGEAESEREAINVPTITEVPAEEPVAGDETDVGEPVAVVVVEPAAESDTGESTTCEDLVTEQVVPGGAECEAAAPEPSTSTSVALAPLAEPDGGSPLSEWGPPTPIPPTEEAKGNDVCPWEDEETCKVDSPFVKTYATLGYL